MREYNAASVAREQNTSVSVTRELEYGPTNEKNVKWVVTQDGPHCITTTFNRMVVMFD